MTQNVPARVGPMVRDPKGIGGSDAAAIVGKDPHKTAYLVAQRILGQIQSDELEGLDHIEFGNEMEGVLARFYERKNKVKLYTPETIVHARHPFMRVNIDRLREDRQDVAIECKNTGLYGKERWGEPGTDDVPDRVLLQCVHGMACAPWIQTFHVLRCFGGNAYQMFVIPRNDSLVEHLESIEVGFYERVLRGELPEPAWGHRTTQETLRRAFQKIEGTIEVKPELTHWTQAWVEANEELKRLKTLEESLKSHVLHMMGEAEVAVLPDGRKWLRKLIKRKGYEVAPTQDITCKLEE